MPNESPYRMNRDKLVLAVYSLDLPSYACAQLRFFQPAYFLRREMRLVWGAKSDGRDYAIDFEAMDRADIIVFQRYFPMDETWPVVERALSCDKPVVYETDDDFLRIPPRHPLKERIEKCSGKVLELMRGADLVTVSTPCLAERFATENPNIKTLPNLLHPGLWPNAPVDRPHGPVRVGFAGTPSHGEDLEMIEEAVFRLSEKHGDEVEIVLFGCSTPGLEQAGLASISPFIYSYADYTRQLRSLNLDIGLAPLADNGFNRAKSSIKWLEYSAAGMAGVYSDLPVYADHVRDGRTGILAGNDPDQWVEAVDGMLRDKDARQRMARAARDHVLKNHSLEKRATEYLEAWRGLAST